jgi:N-methylhydantoinase B/oxoprolinase/acetone carboxylase alpha subunit
MSLHKKGQHLSKDIRAKMSEAKKGKTRSLDVRAKISAANKGKHMIIGPDGKRHWSI